MSLKQIAASRTSSLRLWAIVLISVWTAGIIASLTWGIQSRQEVTIEEAQREVRAYLNKDILFRNWVADHGGIYIPSNGESEVDPILSETPDGTVTTPGGKKLTWASHAFVTSTLHKRSEEKLKVYGRIVSLDPILPENTPDEWEKHALDHFAEGAKEETELTTIDGEPYMRVMQPAVTEQACLQCHGNYEVGSIRGGLSASIPMTPYYTHESKEIKAYLYAHAAIWFIGLLGFGIATTRLSKRAQERDAAENSLRESEEKFHKFSAAAQDAVLFMDSSGNIAYWNQAAESTFGYTADEALGKNLHELLAPEQYHEAFNKAFPEFQKTGEGAVVGQTVEFVALRKDGSEFPIEVSLSSTRIGGEWHGLGILRDITERKQAEKAIELSLNIQRVLDTILNLSLPPLSLKEILAKALDALLAIPAFALLNKGAIFLVAEDGKNLELVVHRNLPEALQQSCALLPFGKCLCGRAAATRETVFADGVDERHEIRYDGIQPHGHYCIPVMVEGELLGVLNAYVSAGHIASEEERKQLKTVADTMGVVIERKRDEETLKQMAHHDNLTGLPNRNVLYDRMNQSLAISRRHQQSFAVLFLDLDHFKEVNDTLGHDAGDELLKEAATRILSCVRREMDTVARVGGDEFTIILMETQEVAGAELVAKKILETLTQPFTISGKECRIGTSIGIAIYPQDGEDSETLVKNADSAMYHAKRERNTFCFFNKIAPS
jgi:diguanylate cyclase (GGDEF)-like protein/PAS domain S-box-containing protein